MGMKPKIKVPDESGADVTPDVVSDFFQWGDWKIIKLDERNLTLWEYRDVAVCEKIEGVAGPGRRVPGKFRKDWVHCGYYGNFTQALGGLYKRIGFADDLKKVLERQAKFEEFLRGKVIKMEDLA